METIVIRWMKRFLPIDKLLQYKLVTTTLHKNILFSFEPIKVLFSLGNTHEVDRSLLIFDYIRSSPLSFYQIDTGKVQFFCDIPRKSSVLSLKDSYLELPFDVLHAADDTVYAVANEIRLVNLGPTHLFSEFKRLTSGG